jgi:hypothetical protein
MKGGKFVSPKHRPPLPPQKISWYSFLLEAQLTPGPQWCRKDYVCDMPMISTEFETATFQLEALSLKQLLHRVTPFYDIFLLECYE